jgi:hypothetical protein
MVPSTLMGPPHRTRLYTIGVATRKPSAPATGSNSAETATVCPFIRRRGAGVPTSCFSTNSANTPSTTYRFGVARSDSATAWCSVSMSNKGLLFSFNSLALLTPWTWDSSCTRSFF